jgi:15-cis-phytoene synthase
MNALYAFNRITDDIGDDESVPIAERQSRLAAWREMVQAALGSQGLDVHSIQSLAPTCLPAIADMVARAGIPHEYLFAVIEGVELDLHPVDVATFGELERYCYHVAGAVGLCCIHVWGFHDSPAVRPLAIDCGLALQLTNILRDLAEDADRGRLYLPEEDLVRFGYSADELRRREMNSAFRDLMQFEVSRARSYYERGAELLGHLAPPGRPILRTMLDIYGGLLNEIEHRKYDVFSTRVSLPKWKKLWFAGRAMIQERCGTLRPSSMSHRA